MNFEPYFHQNSKKVISATILHEVENAITGITLSEENVSVTEVVSSIRTALTKQGWSGEVFLSQESRITISGMKGDIGLALQFGNVSRIYADLLKLQCLFLDGKIRGGVVILPQRRLLSSLSRSGGTDNRCHIERIMRELPIFALVVTVPITFYGVAQD